MKLLFAALLMSGFAVSARAQLKTVNDMSAPISQGSAVKYSDLLGLVLTDADLVGPYVSATKTIVVRHVSNDHKPIALEGKFEVNFLEAVTLRDPSGPVTLLQFDLTADNLEDSDMAYGSEASLVAAFQTSPNPRLLDVLDVKSDRFTEILQEQPVYPIGPNQDAFVVVSAHFNSNQSFEDIGSFFLRNGKIEPVVEALLLQSRGCGMDVTETLTFSSRPSPGRQYFSVTVRVKVVKSADDENCDRRTAGYVKAYSAVYRWNPGKRQFMSGSPAMARLDAFNKNRT